MPWIPVDKGVFATVVCVGGIGFGPTLAAAATNNTRMGMSVVTTGGEPATRRLKAQLSLAKRLPDAFSGIQEIESVNLTLDNLDGALSFLLNEDPEGKLVRIRRLDEVDDTITEVFQGIISKSEIGDEVKIGLDSLDMNLFDTEFPKNRVYHEEQIPPEGYTSKDITLNFPYAPETNVPIPIVFGRAELVPIQKVFADAANKVYDYIVCEGIADVESISWLKEDGWAPKFTSSGTAQDGGASTITLDALDTQGDAYESAVGFYVDLYVKITGGPGWGQVRRITAYDKLTKIATVESTWATIPTFDSQYEIQEYEVLPGTVYYGRTAIRFRKDQLQGGSAHQLAATVVRYRSPKRNLLTHTEEFENNSIYSADPPWYPYAQFPIGAKLLNPGFETGDATNWNFVQDAAVTTTGARNGSYCAAAGDAGETTSLDMYSLYATNCPAVDPGEMWRASSWFMGQGVTAGGSLGATLHLRWLDSSKTYLSQTSADQVIMYEDDNDTWARTTVTGAAPAGASFLCLRVVSGWISPGITLSIDDCDLSLIGPTVTSGITDSLGGTNAIRIATGETVTAIGFAQTRPTIEVGTTHTASLWARSPDGTCVSLHLMDGDTGPAYSSIIAPTSTWQRFSITSGAVISGLTINAGVKIDPNTSDVEIFGFQCESGDTTSAYEPVYGVGQGGSFTFPDAIKDVLSNPFWGLNRPIDHDSFDTANSDLEDLYLRCEGSLPNVELNSLSAKELLDELLLTRGMRLQKSGSAWQLIVDTAQSSGHTFGTYETPENNIVAIGSLRRPDLTERVSEVRVDYGLTTRAESGEPIFPFRLIHTLGDIGKPKELQLHFVRGHNTADRIVQYHANRIQINERVLTATFGLEAQDLIPGDVLTLSAPRRQVENRILDSEDLTTSAWDFITSNGSRTANSGLDPERRSYSATKIVTGTSLGVQIYQDFLTGLSTGDDHGGRRTTFSVWLRSEKGTYGVINAAIQDGAGEGDVTSEDWIVGPSWKKYTLSHWFLPENSWVIAYVLTANALSLAAPTTWYAWGAQVTLDYDNYAYIRTGSTGTTAQKLWQVIEIAERRNGEFDVELVPYDSTTLFAYTAKDIPTSLLETKELDPRINPPYIATSISVPADPPTPTAAAGVMISAEGTSDSWADIAFNMPTMNVSYVEIQRQAVDEDGDPFESKWELIGSVGISEVGFGRRAKIRGHNFTPGIRYAIRAVSYNSAGLTQATFNNPTLIARGDETAPNPPDTVTMRQGTGRMIEIDCAFANLPDDFGFLRLYRAEGASAVENDAVLIERSSKLRLHDTNVTYTTVYKYWVQTEDMTGNLSSTKTQSLTADTFDSITISQGALADIEAGIVQAETLRLLEGAAGNQLLNPGFEIGDATNWTFTQDGGVTTAGARTGSYCAAIGDPSIQERLEVYADSANNIPAAAPGEGWQASAWAAAEFPIPSSISMWLFLRWLDTSKVLISADSTYLYLTDENWHQMQITAIAPAGTSYAQLVVWSAEISAGQTLSIDDCSLYELGGDINLLEAQDATGSAAGYRIPVTSSASGATLGYIQLYDAMLCSLRSILPNKLCFCG
jgi:hypothetical protein